MKHFYEALSKVTLGELKIPYVTNVDANIIKDTERTKELLKALTQDIEQIGNNKNRKYRLK